MCIRDRAHVHQLVHDAATIGVVVAEVAVPPPERAGENACLAEQSVCLLYTSDAADERSSVDLGGRRIIKKNNTTTHTHTHTHARTAYRTLK